MIVYVIIVFISRKLHEPLHILRSFEKIYLVTMLSISTTDFLSFLNLIYTIIIVVIIIIVVTTDEIFRFIKHVSNNIMRVFSLHIFIQKYYITTTKLTPYTLIKS